jgi:hypothetical protein
MSFLIFAPIFGFSQNFRLLTSDSIKCINIEYVEITLETPMNVNCDNFKNYFPDELIKVRKIVNKHQINEIIDGIDKILKLDKQYPDPADVRIKIFIKRTDGRTQIFCMGRLTSSFEGRNYVNNKKFVSMILKYLN